MLPRVRLPHLWNIFCQFIESKGTQPISGYRMGVERGVPPNIKILIPKYIIMVNRHFECQADDIDQWNNCPLETGESEPYYNEDTGEYQCPECLVVLN